MNSCKEFELDDLTAITAIPVCNAFEDRVFSPANRLAPTIPSAQFYPDMTGAVTIGQRPASAGVALVPIMRGTGKAKDDSSDGVSGRAHSVTVSCEADDRDPSAWDTLLLLERVPRHLLLTFRNGTKAFASATEDSYVCTVERSGSKTSVQFRVDNLMGIQLIV